MKVFIPCEDDFLDQLCPDDRLVPWQTCWTDYLKQREAPKVLTEPQGGEQVRRPESAPTSHPGIASSNIRDPLP